MTGSVGRCMSEACGVRAEAGSQLGGCGVQTRSDGGFERGPDDASDERCSDPASVLKMWPIGTADRWDRAYESERSMATLRFWSNQVKVEPTT